MVFGNNNRKGTNTRGKVAMRKVTIGCPTVSSRMQAAPFLNSVATLRGSLKPRDGCEMGYLD